MEKLEVKIVAPEGKMDTANCDRIRYQVMSVVRTKPAALLIDMRNVSFIDSMGLGILMAASVRVKAWGGKIAISAPSESVKLLLKTTNMDQFFEVYESCEDFFGLWNRKLVFI